MFEFSFKSLCGIVDVGGGRKEIAQEFLRPSPRLELLQVSSKIIIIIIWLQRLWNYFQHRE
jgi:hypothetical protein